MKISDIRPGVVDIYKKQNEKKQPVPKDGSVPEPDRADISSRGRELQHYREVLKAMPDTRQDRVEDLKKRIAEGKYQPSADKTAEKIMEERRLDTRC